MSSVFLVRGARARGAATVEGVVVLPVFVILFVGVIFVRDMLSARFEAQQEARRCAWAYSDNGCEAVPADCAQVLAEPRLDMSMPKASQVKDQLIARVGDVHGGITQAGIRNIIEGVVTGYIVKALTWKFDATRVVERKRPHLFGGGTSLVPGHYRLACNVAETKQESLIGQVWQAIKHH
jgi:hypothetical protein